ncbi:MAG: hypothetical protein GY751_12235 [Bacteroidetes bacterium]|nr:hypothetical protein [Bacteroidota bacterium]
MIGYIFSNALRACFSIAISVVCFSDLNAQGAPAGNPHTGITFPQSYKPAVFGMDTKDGKLNIKGSNYIHDEWQSAQLKLADGSEVILDAKVRIDIVNWVLEQLTGTDTLIIPSFQVQTIKLAETNETFSPKKVIGEDGPPGFYRVLYQDKSSLYCHYSTYLKKANYNAALDTGNNYDEIKMLKTYFVRLHGSLIRLDNKKSARLDQLGGQDIQGLVKKNKIDLRKEEGLISLLKLLDGNQ